MITKDNYHLFAPEELAHAVDAGKINFVEFGLEAATEIVKLISSAIANGPRIKRIRALEDFAEAQLKLNAEVLRELAELKAKK